MTYIEAVLMSSFIVGQPEGIYTISVNGNFNKRKIKSQLFSCTENIKIKSNNVNTLYS